MWAADRVVALTPGFAIIIPETANEFAIKGNHLTLIKGNQFDGRTKTDPHKHIHEFLGICDMFKYRDTENEAVRLMMFPLSLTGEAKTWLDELNEGIIKTRDELQTAFIIRFFPLALFDLLLVEIRVFSQHENESLTDAWLRMKKMLRNCHGHNLSKGNIIKIFYHGLNKITQEVLNAATGGSSNSKTDKIMARMDAMTMKMDAQYKEFQSRSKQPNLDDDDIPMSREKEAKFILGDKQSGRPSGSLPSNTQPNPKGSSSKPYQPPQARNEQVDAVFTQSGKSYDPPVNPNDQNNSETPINFDSDDEDDESTPQPKPKNPKPVKETSIPKPYKPKIPYPQRLRKEKMEAQYGKFLDMIRAVRINVPLVDVLAGMHNYGKFLKELVNNKNKIEQISAPFLSDESFVILQNKVPPKIGDPGTFLIPCHFNKAFSCNALAELAETMLVEVGKFTFPADFVILEMEEDSKVPFILGRTFFHTADAVIRVKQKQLNLRVGIERMIFHIDSAMKHSYSNDDTYEGSEILHSIEGTILEEKLFVEFYKFMAMTADENSESESDTEEPPFDKITFNTDYKIKTSFEEPPTDFELKPLPDNLEYVFLEEPSFLPVIISSQLSEENKNKLIFVLKKHKQAFAWKTIDIPRICPSFCKHKIQLLVDKKPVVQKQILNPNMQEVMKKEIVKVVDTSIIYPIVDSPWVSHIYCVPKKGGITVITNKKDELVLTRTVTGWLVCIDYRKLNEATAKDHFPLPFMDQVCMLAIFHDMIEESVKVFMDDFSVFGNSFDHCLNNLDKMLQRCKDAHLVLNWEKCHFMVNEGIVLRHKVSEAGLEVDKAKIKVISKLPPPLISKLLEKDTPFEFNEECHNAFKLLKEKLTCAPVITKGIDCVVADHLSRIENDEISDDSKVDDNFPGEALMEINTRNEPKLDDAMWAFRTAYKTPTGTSPYKLVYGKNCHLPFEIEHRAYWALKNCNPDLIAAGEK
ncbi:reverse transcriptase domain-containing protein [Tanacetum coccineum]